MKFIKQFGIILAISFIGEILNYLIPLPVPASIYGLVLMLLCLHFGIVHIDSVKDSGKFLIEIMPLMFIPAAVGLIESWKTIGPKIGTYLIITVLSEKEIKIPRFFPYNFLKVKIFRLTVSLHDIG